MRHSPRLAGLAVNHKRADPFDPRPRTGSLSWDDYFMSLAFLSAQRSKDPNKQVGACIVSRDNIIQGIGYNGFPRGCSDHRLPWSKCSGDGDILKTKYPYVVHAEANALLNKNSAMVDGSRVYVTLFPCNECAKLMIQAGIVEVIYHEAKVEEGSVPTGATSSIRGETVLASSYQASITMLKLAGVKLRQHVLSVHSHA